MSLYPNDTYVGLRLPQFETTGELSAFETAHPPTSPCSRMSGYLIIYVFVICAALAAAGFVAVPKSANQV